MPNTSTSLLLFGNKEQENKEDLDTAKAVTTDPKITEENSRPEPLECLVELKDEDPLTQIQYRDCLIDYTSCPNSHCIKNLS